VHLRDLDAAGSSDPHIVDLAGAAGELARRAAMSTRTAAGVEGSPNRGRFWWPKSSPYRVGVPDPWASSLAWRGQPAAMTSISTSQSLTSVSATIAVVGTTRPSSAATRAAAFASA
jgi:hypothetical protein